MTGIDMAETFRGRYRTGLGALRVLREQGMSGPSGFADQLLGHRQHPAKARAGDVVAADASAMGISDGSPLGLSLGICYGRSSLFVGRDGDREGLVSLPTLSLEACWHV